MGAPGKTLRAPHLKPLQCGPSEVFHFELNAEVLVEVRSGNRSVAMIFPFAVASHARAQEHLAKLAAAAGAKPSALEAKLLGDKKIIAALGKQLASLGFGDVVLRDRSGPLEVYYSPSEGRIRVASLERAGTSSAPSLPKIDDAPKGPVKVLIIDDSKTIRTLLSAVLARDPQIEIVGQIADPLQAMDAIRKLRPHVITLDIHMPGMDGVTLLKRYLPEFPIPTVMISSVSMEEGPLVLTALETGAVDYVQKPTHTELEQLAPVLIEKVKGAAKARVRTGSTSSNRVHSSTKSSSQAVDLTNSPLIAIGSSTGGTEALRQVLTQLPAQIPPTLIVQHIPAVFSRAFADRMNQLCPFEVKEAADGDEVRTNRVLIAPGATQMRLEKQNQRWVVRIDPDAAPMNRHKPSVDFLFHSIAKFRLKQVIGVILTGMGADGAKGLLELRQQGARTIGQDEATSVVYGMPRVSMEIGAVEQQCALHSVAPEIMNRVSSRKSAA